MKADGVKKEGERRRGLEEEACNITLDMDKAGGATEQHDILKDSEAPDGGWGWVVTISAFTFMFVAAIPCTCFGIMFSQLLMSMGTSSLLTATIFNLSLVLSGVFGYLSGPLMAEFGWRRVAFLSSLVFGMGLMVSSLATSAWFLIFFYSIEVGCNIEILMNVAYTVIPHYFSRWRNVANSIMTSGISSSQMMMPGVITYLQEEYSYRGATLILGALTLNCCAAALVLHPVEWHRHHTYTSIRTNTKQNENTQTRGESHDHKSGCLKRIFSKSVHTLHYMKSPRVLLIVVQLGMMYTVLFNVFALVPFAMLEAGFTQRESSFCLALSGACNMVSRLVTAFLACCPTVKLRHVYLFGSLLAATSVVGFSVGSTLKLKAVTMALCGVGYGVAASLYNLVIVEELGLPMIIPTLSIASLIMGILYGVLGPLTGIVCDMSGSYLGSLCVCAACLMGSVALGFLMPVALALKQSPKHHQHHTHANNHNYTEETPQLQRMKPEKETSLLVHSTKTQQKHVTYSATNTSIQD